MPLIISGYLAVPVSTLRAHAGHALHAVGDGRIALICDPCDVILEREPEPIPDIGCGCRAQAEHDEGVAMQADMRKKYRIPRSTCVGCAMGDAGLTLHSCAIHPI